MNSITSITELKIKIFIIADCINNLSAVMKCRHDVDGWINTGNPLHIKQ